MFTVQVSSLRFGIHFVYHVLAFKKEPQEKYRMESPAPDPLKVRELILSKGLSLAEFSRLMHSSKMSVQNWIARGFPGARVYAVCDILGLSPEEIRPYTQEGSRPPPDVEAELNAFSRRFAAMTPQQQHAALAQLNRHLKPL